MDEESYHQSYEQLSFQILNKTKLFQYTSKYEFKGNTLIQEYEEFCHSLLPSIFKFGTEKLHQKIKRMNFSLVHVDTLCTSYSKEYTKEFFEVLRITLYLYYEFKQKQLFHNYKKLLLDKTKLPIYEYKEIILQSIKENQVVIISGDTGCGKSTQIPQYLYESGYQRICVTQPRRISAISLANRVQEELQYDTTSTAIVGYQIRFESNLSQTSAITYCTEGILIRKLLNSTISQQYDVIILDEVHERHIQCDFLMGILSILIKQNKNMRLILMSATIDTSIYSSLFPSYKVITVPGRMFSVDIKYCPISDSIKPKSHSNNELVLYTLPFETIPYLRILEYIDSHYDALTERGDVLIFVSGMRDIQLLKAQLDEYALTSKRWYILQLHSTLSKEEQNRVFKLAPPGIRKCIISTNIAETSVTLPDIRFVIDSGKMKQLCVSTSSSSFYTLFEYYISQANADQRKGRAGRTGPGLCFRLYSEDEYNNMNKYTEPEIVRIPVDDMALQLLLLSRKNQLFKDHHLLSTFPFLNSPPSQNISRAYTTLFNLQAIQMNEIENSPILTTLGESLALLPLSPSVGTLCIYGAIFNKLYYVLLLAASLSIQTLYISKNSKSSSNENNTLNVINPLLENDSHCLIKGDILNNINVLREWIQMKSEHKNTYSWCKKMNINENSIYDCIELVKQYISLLNNTNIISIPNDISVTKNKKQILSVKRNMINNKSKKRSILTYNEIYESDENNTNNQVSKKQHDEDNEYDYNSNQSTIFTLSTNIHSLANHIATFSKNDKLFLSVLASMCLYPNLAISDPVNISRKPSEYIYNTISMNNIQLHPTSILNQYLLDEKYDDDDFPFEHNIIIYEKIQESLHPYIYNTLLFPALPILLLLSHSIDTNSSLNSFLFDKWIYVEIENTKDSIYMLQKSQEIKQNIHLYLNNVLETISSVQSSNKNSKENNSSPIDLSQFSNLQDKVQKCLEKLYYYESTLYKPSYSVSEDIYDQVIRYMNVNIKYKITYVTPTTAKYILGELDDIQSVMNRMNQNNYDNTNDSNIIENMESILDRNKDTNNVTIDINNDIDEKQLNKDVNKFNFVIHKTNTKRQFGKQITSVIWYGSIKHRKDDSDNIIYTMSDTMEIKWNCPYCSFSKLLTKKNILNHLQIHK